MADSAAGVGWERYAPAFGTEFDREVLAVHERAERLAEEVGDRDHTLRARWNRWRVHNVRAGLADAIAIGDALLREAEAESDAAHGVQAWQVLWSSHLFRGDLELRAARDPARPWAERGERQKAHDLLAPVYGCFTEGFDTADPEEATQFQGQLG